MDMYPGDSFLSEYYQRGKPAETLRSFVTTLAGNDREGYVKAFETILQTEPPALLEKEKDEILETLECFSQDPDIKYRAYLADSLISLCGSCIHQQEHAPGTFGYSLLCAVFKVALRYLSDNKRVQHGAYKTVIYLIENGYLLPDIVEDDVCPAVLELCKTKPAQSDDSDHLSSAIGIIAKVVPIIGQQKTYDMFYEIFIKITKCSAFSIRKQCAKVFPIMCEVLGAEMTEDKMLPIFFALCDDSVWGTRKTCAEVMPQMSLLVSMEMRRRKLVIWMKNFLFDTSEWVILAALKSLGPFLATFAYPQIFGLAYDFRLDLNLTNAADEKFRERDEKSAAPYGSQSDNNAIILRNLEMYERELEALLDPLSAAQRERLSAPETSFAVDEFLAQVASAAETNESKRVSIGSASESGDTGISSFVYPEERADLNKFLVKSKVQMTQNLEQYRKDDDVFARFVKHCLPFKNNFNNGAVNEMKQMNSMRDSDEMDMDKIHHSLLKHKELMQTWPALPPPPLDVEVEDNENNNQKTAIRNQVNRLTQELAKMITITTLVEQDNIEAYNSHQFWYIPPPEIDISNSNIEVDEEKERTSSCDSTVIVTSEFDALEGIECEQETRRLERKTASINPALLEGETEWCLIEDFIHMKDIDSEILFDCAYFFPAVIFTFGSRFWPFFQPHFNDLCYHFTATIRKTMAASISQVALMIGREHATRDLITPLMYFFLDSDDVKMAMIKGLSTFIKVIDPVEHGKILNQLDMCLLPHNKKINWRFRETVGLQLIKLIEMHEQINKKHCILYLIGISFKLMSDSYDCVRKVGVEAFIEAFRRSQHKLEVLEYLRDKFALDVSWKRKQLYILTVDKMLAENAVSGVLFHQQILEVLLNLSTHKIPNIRLYVAKCLSTTVLRNEYFQTDLLREIVGVRVYELSNDEDRDVRENAVLQNVQTDAGNLGSLVKNVDLDTTTSADDQHEVDITTEDPSEKIDDTEFNDTPPSSSG